MADNLARLGGRGNIPPDALPLTPSVVDTAPGGPGVIETGLVWPTEAREFAARQAGTVDSEPLQPVHREAAAAWLERSAAAVGPAPDAVGQTAGADDPDALVRSVLARAEAHPSKTVLLETQAILNELGRDPDLTAAITTHLTRGLVHRIAGSREG
jgi:hypothetical protein